MSQDDEFLSGTCRQFLYGTKGQVEGLMLSVNRKLLQVVLSLGGEFDDYLIKKSDDLVLSAAEMAKKGLEVPVIPPGGRLISATFEIKLKAAKTAACSQKATE